MEEANERDWVPSIKDVLMWGGVKAGKYSFGNPCTNSVERRSNLVKILQMSFVMAPCWREGESSQFPEGLPIARVRRREGKEGREIQEKFTSCSMDDSLPGLFVESLIV